jgi:hypothetical protein
MASQAAEHVIEREQSAMAKLNDDRLLDLGQDRALWLARPIGRSAVVVRLRHFATVLAFTPYRATRRGCSLSLLGDRLEYAASCGLRREDLLPKCVLPLTAEGCTVTFRD